MENQDDSVLYNGECPICSREIAIYERRAARGDAPLKFVDLTRADLSAFGISQEDAARRLHVIQNGQVLVGAEAFIALWSRTPGFKTLGRILALPCIRQVASLTYDTVVAPWLYRRHLRRQAAKS